MSKALGLMIAATVFLAALSSGAAAREDYCGPAYSQVMSKLVPDFIDPVGSGPAVPFTFACERHDLCYRSSAYLITEKYGDVGMFSLVTNMKRMLGTTELKRRCDGSFGDDLRLICGHVLEGWKKLFQRVQCRALAAAYEKVMFKTGALAFWKSLNMALDEQQATQDVGDAALTPGGTFRDCSDCPEMVVIPAGSFRMGDLDGGGRSDEKPVHTVTIPGKFAVGRYEVTRGEFSAFVNDTGYGAGGGCHYWTGSKVEKSGSKNWRSPGFGQMDRDPVVCVSWDDAKAYVRWLGRKAGREYRLPSESEWEYMARAGGTAKYPFGDLEGSLCEYGNGADRSTGLEWKNTSCSDGYGEKTAPVGNFKPNTFGVYDTVGNVWEWVEDCWHDSYNGAPSDGRAWTSGGNCERRVLRGGSWGNDPWYLRSANRRRSTADFRGSVYGFRIARTLSR